MDEFLDIVDLFDIFPSWSDLAPDGIDLTDLLDTTDLPSCEFDWLEEVAGVGEVPDPSEGMDLTGGVEPELAHGFETTLPNGEVVHLYVPSPETMPQLINDALSSYPPDLLEGLEDINYVHDDAVVDNSYLGEWGQDAQGNHHIKLNGHSGSSWETFHHEMGHHIAERNPLFKQGLLEAIRHGGFDVDQAAFLEGYSIELQPAEACAEAIAMFKANPLAFAQDYPGVAQFLEARICT